MRTIRVWKGFWQWGGPALGLLSISRVFDFTVQQAISGAALLGSKILTVKVVWLVLAPLSFYLSLVEWLRRNTPLTVISIRVSIYLERADGARALVVKEHSLRPNRDDVKGYQTRFWADPVSERAEIEDSSVSMNVDHCKADEQDQFVISKSRKEWLVVHQFAPMPMPFYKFGLNIVNRTERHRLLHSFENPVEWYDIRAPKIYHTKKLTVTIYFHKDNPGVFRESRGYWIAKHGVVEEKLRDVAEAGQQGFRLEIRKPVQGDIYRVQWKYLNDPAQVRV